MDDDYQIYLVKPDKNKENSSTLNEVFETLKKTDNNLKLQWLSQEDCLKVSSRKKNVMYIFDVFDGEGYNHIRNLGFRIYGPRCILANLLYNMELPRTKTGPIYNLAMKGIKLCCTSVDKMTRDEVMRLTQLMGGEVTSDLTTDITHLIAGEVGSNKYLVASESGKKIMVKDWVYKVWEISQDRHILATDDMFTKFTCPAFLGLTIVVSGFTGSQKNKLRNFIIHYGGKYSGELKMNECTHLVVKEPKGPKFEAAKKWRIKIVNETWLLDCVDKQRYLNPNSYQFNSEGSTEVNTSTPERQSVVGPQINDISAISHFGPNTSMSRVDETNLTTTRLSSMFITGKTANVAETRLETTVVNNESTLAPADIFLDGCKIFLSGIKPTLEDKAKKIILAGGGLRALDISEGITHVVVGDKIASQLKQIFDLHERPCIVNLDWLMDCFAQNVHMNEDKYLCNDLDQEPANDKEKHTKKQRGSAGNISLDVNKSKLEDKRISGQDRSNLDKSGFRTDAPSDMEMAELLSQYMEAIAPVDAHKDNETDGNKPSDDVGDLDNMTQDPNNVTTEENKGIFNGLSFIVLGFEDEETTNLTTYIIQNGGQVNDSSKKRHISDIAVVPLNIYPVDVTVSEILTNAWLELCIENNILIPYDGHWLNRPMDLPDNEPLKGLCITVSGYTGVERNWIIQIAAFLGADCQKKFSRRSNESVKVNTHLIVNEPTGTKYVAAKKWNLPAVSKEWLIACIHHGEKVSEDNFLVENIYQKQLDVDKERTASDSRLPSETLTLSSVKCQAGNENAGSDRTYQFDNNVATKQSPVAEVGQASDKVPSSSGESLDNGKNDSKNPIKEALVRLNETSVFNNDRQRKHTDMTTPASVLRQKWLHANNIHQESPATTPYGLIRGGGESPATFLKPDFKPKFNIDGVFSSPECSDDLNKSTPWYETFRKTISKAAQLAEAQNASPSDQCHPQQSQSQHDLPPLHGVIIAVAKKLGRSHEQYNNTVVELGGNYSWQMGPNVTHFVFQGRPNDTNKEFRNAREQGKIIVSPYWLFACKEQNVRVDESLFPHNYNPSHSLSVTPGTKSTPARSTRMSSKSTESVLIPASTPLKVPSKKLPVLNLMTVSSAESKETVSAQKPSSAKLTKSHPVVAKDAPVKNIHAECITSDQNPVTSSTDDDNISDKEKDDQNKHPELKDAVFKLIELASVGSSRSKDSLKKTKMMVDLSGQQSESSSSESMSKKTPLFQQDNIKEPSQSLGIVWDNATGRIEEENLLSKQPIAPSQNTEELLLQAVEIQQQIENTSTNIKTTEENISNKEVNYKSPTPEPPPLAFPTAKSKTAIPTPQPVKLLEDETQGCNVTKSVFMMSGLQNEERLDYSALIEQLGGTFVDKPNFQISCTHLIVAQPSRNEKCLSSVASGKWVLHKSYLEACRKERKFVEESPHEWGSVYTTPLLQKMDKLSAKLALAAHTWRLKIAELRKINPSCRGAFDGWKVLLCVEEKKEDNFKRMLEAGGATVTILKSPFPENISGTHAFVDLNKVKIPQNDLEQILLADIHCLKAEFIPAYLVEDPNPEDFYPEEVQALKACLSEVGKSRKRRRGQGDSEKQNKIARH